VLLKCSRGSTNIVQALHPACWQPRKGPLRLAASTLRLLHCSNAEICTTYRTSNDQHAPFANVPAIHMCACVMLQMSDPIYMYRLWDPEVRYARRCLSRHNNMMMNKVKHLREQPPAPHTIAGQCGVCRPSRLKPLSQLRIPGSHHVCNTCQVALPLSTRWGCSCGVLQ
jgi:hypothetical protein